MAIAPIRLGPAGASDPDLMMLDGLVPQLCGASPLAAVAIVAALSMRQRAHLAISCYARVHLRPVGIAIAATCSLPALLRAAPSDACAHAIHAASQDPAPEPAKPQSAYRRPVTLATSASGSWAPGRLFPDVIDDEEDDEQPVCETPAASVPA